MAYIPGTADEILVGSAAFYVARGTIDGQAANVAAPTAANDGTLSAGSVILPGFVEPATGTNDGVKYGDYIDAIGSWDGAVDESGVGVKNVGYTTDGLELTITPDIGEVQVDQVLDSARLYKQGMTASVKTSVAEATLENLVYALAYDEADLETGVANVGDRLTLNAGGLGDCPTERGFVAIGVASGDCGALEERVYIGYRGLSTEAVTVSAKRDTPSQFDINLRLLPHTFSHADEGTPATGSYGRIVDRDLAQ